MRRLSFVLSAALTLFPISSSAATDTVTWMDDFLGIKYDQRYHALVAHGGDVKIASNPSIGGWLALVTDNTPESVARFRLGEDPKVSPYDAMPFSAGKNVSGKARIKVNMGQSIELTVGFVGRNDPDNVIAALYRPDMGWGSASQQEWAVRKGLGGGEFLARAGADLRSRNQGNAERSVPPHRRADHGEVGKRHGQSACVGIPDMESA